jgi:WD40 repeat protein/DNA-binding CsgD family transcriptional regulator
MASVSRSGGAASDFPMADDAARERGRLRESEARIAGQVVEFQLARQRAELVVPEIIEPLSTREREVLELLAVGRTDGEIAEALFISKKTASVHVANIKGKLGASTRVEIALIAERLGLVGDPTNGASSAAWAVARAGRPGERCPFKGLAPFEAADAPFFFGRERLIADMVARLVGATFLAIVGPSGSGKSSAVRAGLLPALAGGVLPGSEGWPQVLLRPGSGPTAALRKAMHDAARAHGISLPDDATIAESRDRLAGERRLVIAVDQFEEVFTLCDVESERTAFIDSLVALADDPSARTHVLVAIRADFFGRCAAYPRLASLIGDGTILVGPPTGGEIERAIEAPARAAGLRVEPELTAELVRDVTGEPGALPLLSTTLLDLWARRDGRTLRSATYRQIGGVSGAVARLAEAAFAKLSVEQQDVARGVLLRLASVGDGDVAVRRPVPRSELDADRDPDVRRVLDVLADARLITVDGASIEVAHEALLRDWPRYVEWLEADREGRRLRDHLRAAAGEWQRAGEDQGELLRGARLAATLDWAAGHQVELNAVERRFLDACRTAAEQEVTRERRTNRRLRGLLIGTVGLLVVALVTGTFAFVQLDRAEREAGRAEDAAQVANEEAQRAESAATVARARELTAASVSVLGEDPSLSKLLAVAAADVAPPDRALESALHRAMAADAIVDRYALPDDVPLGEHVADLHRDGKLIVTSSIGRAQNAIAVADLASDQRLWRYESPSATADIGPAFFSPDGLTVVAAVRWDRADGPSPPRDTLGLIILDARTGHVMRRFDTGPCGTELIAVSVTHAMIATADEVADCFTGGANVETIDLTTGVRRVLVTEPRGDGTLSRDGRYAAITDPTDPDGVRGIVVDLHTGERVLRLDVMGLPQSGGLVRALSSDGKLLAYGERPMLVIDVETGAQIATLHSDGGESFGVAFAPVGTTVYGSGRDGTLRAWDAETGEPLNEVPAVGAGWPSATSDGHVLLADFTSGLSTLLAPPGRGDGGTVLTCDGFVRAGALQVAGDVAAFSTFCDDGPVGTDIVRASDLEPISRIAAAGGQEFALSPDGSRAAIQTQVGLSMGAMHIYDVATGRELATLAGTCDWSDGYVGPREEAGPECRPFPQTPFALWSSDPEFSPDGRFLKVYDDPFNGHDSPFIGIWDADDGDLVTTLSGFEDEIQTSLFTPDAKELILSHKDGQTMALSTKTWRVLRRGRVETSDDPGTLRLFGFLPDSTLVAVGGMGFAGGGSLHWIDPTTFEVKRSVRAHDGSPKSVVLSPDGSRIATGASDGVVRIWDAMSGDLLNQFQVSGQAQGVAFLDDRRVGVMPSEGNVLVFHLDTDGLLGAATASLTRGFTPDECTRFGFGDACPTLDELRGPADAGTDPEPVPATGATD